MMLIAEIASIIGGIVALGTVGHGFYKLAKVAADITMMVRDHETRISNLERDRAT